MEDTLLLLSPFSSSFALHLSAKRNKKHQKKISSLYISMVNISRQWDKYTGTMTPAGQQ